MAQLRVRLRAGCIELMVCADDLIVRLALLEKLAGWLLVVTCIVFLLAIIKKLTMLVVVVCVCEIGAVDQVTLVLLLLTGQQRILVLVRVTGPEL